MSPSQCPYCERGNPPDSKFCNACGAPLYLLPCRNCGAVNEAGATTCHQCKAALSEGKTGEDAISSDALDADAKVLARLHELRRRLGNVEAGDAGAPARGVDWGGIDAPAQALAPELASAPVTDTPIHYPAPAIAFPAGPPARRSGRVRPAKVIIGTAALAAAGVAVLYTFDYRQLADASKGPIAAGEVKGEANAAAGNGPANADAANTAAAPVKPGAALLPRVTHGVAKSAAPALAAAAASRAVPAQGGAPQPGPSAAQHENRVTSDLPAAASLPRVTHGVAQSPAPAPAAAAAGNAVPPAGERPRTGTTAAQRENRAASATPAASEGVPPRAVVSGTGIERPDPARIGPCTDALATLGLCKPEPTQRRE